MTKSEDRAVLSVAPMMAWTDRHCRMFHRQITRHTLLYTEMVTAPALVRGGAVHLLEYNADEHPVALQLGGSDRRELAAAARIGADHGYDEINLNVGCPSDRVQSGTFGAVLMKTPELVAECVSEMSAAVSVPVTVKCRLGVDDQEPTETLPTFLEHIEKAGIKQVTIHARKAWLQGLSPKENRDIPPLDYELVVAMSEASPNLSIGINGGIETLSDARALVAKGRIASAMIGRAAYHQPFDLLSQADREMFAKSPSVATREDVLDAMEPYISNHLQSGGTLHQVTRHMLGLYAGRPGARQWRRILSEKATGADAGLEVMHEAKAAVAAAQEIAA